MIVFKSVYFSTIVNFIDLFKPAELTAVVDRLYDTSKYILSEREFSKLMMGTLFTCHRYRNLAAHGGRIYNYTCDIELPALDNVKYPPKGFFCLLFLLSLLKYQRPYETLSNALGCELDRHCSAFPSDLTYLGNILNIDIEPKYPVYVAGRGKKYHSDPHCSGMLNAAEMDLREAQKAGYHPCQRCCSNIPEASESAM